MPKVIQPMHPQAVAFRNALATFKSTCNSANAFSLMMAFKNLGNTITLTENEAATLLLANELQRVPLKVAA